MKHHHKLEGLVQRQAQYAALPLGEQAARTRPGGLKQGDSHPRQKPRSVQHRKNRRKRTK